MEQGNVTFKCPACGKEEIIRSKHDRQIAAPYKCSKCGFEGPN
ncbi:RNA-binding protein [Candidatus Woesearchaeota archaeon]|nr:RNA-binding protein [Candidatus Woesearchaeota archaeon]